MGSRTRPGSRELQELADVARTDLVLIQVASAFVADHHHLTLRDLSPTTIWLLDGPTRRIGHLSTGTFLDLWWDPCSGLGTSSLPALLGRAAPEAEHVPDPILMLRSPRINGAGIQYDVEEISGTLPSHSGACVLFLGPGRAAH